MTIVNCDLILSIGKPKLKPMHTTAYGYLRVG